MPSSPASTRRIALAGLIAAVYTVLALLSSLFGLAYGPIQCRFSEALTLLPLLLPEAVPGLVIGCFVTNLLSSAGPLDLVIGPLATLLAALWTRRMPNRFLAAIPPVLCNSLLVGGLLTWYATGATERFWSVLPLYALSVAIGEAMACFVLGVPLMGQLKKHLPPLK